LSSRSAQAVSAVVIPVTFDGRPTVGVPARLRSPVVATVVASPVARFSRTRRSFCW
jgi:hypothetical protein